MRRSCDGCGKPYEAKRSDSKFCSSTCRSRASVARVHAPAVAVVPVDDPSESVYAVTREILSGVERLRSAAGVKALVLARQMDAPGHTGPSLAALSKEHTALLAQALEGVQVAADPVDELEKRRLAKLAAG